MGLNPQSSAYKNDIFPKCTTLSIVNTNFKNSGNVFFLVRGNLHVDNCKYFILILNFIANIITNSKNVYTYIIIIYVNAF